MAKRRHAQDAKAEAAGVSTFAYSDLLNTALSPRMSQVVLVAFFLAFAVKLPLVPFHTWQASTYASAPTEVSILLAALMAKTAGYGLLRYALPLFPGALETVTPWAMALGVVTILYAAWMAYGQQDLKRLIAYSSAGHLGFVLLGAFSNTPLGQSGAIAVMLSHGLSVTGLFVVVGMLERRTGSTNIDSMGGIWTVSPRLGGLALALAMATLGLPGLGNFVGEFLVLAGLFPTHPWLTAFAALGAIFSAAYALRLIRNAFYGPTCEHVDTKPESTPLLFVCAFLVLALLWLGIYPKPILNAARIAYVTPVQNTSDTTADQNTAPGDHP